MLIQYGSLKRKIVAVSFFFDAAIWQFFFLKFDPTLTSHNSGLKNYSNKNYHIFRKPWTSAFRWYTLDTSEKCSNLRKKRLRLHSFGPLWTISTGNQWEISEFDRLSCFSDFFVWFHIACDRYTSYYAHFTFFRHNLATFTFTQLPDWHHGISWDWDCVIKEEEKKIFFAISKAPAQWFFVVLIFKLPPTFSQRSI